MPAGAVERLAGAGQHPVQSGDAQEAAQPFQRPVEAEEGREVEPRDAVERELLHLHQYRKLRYEVAGSLVELTLPYGSAAEYAESLIHGQLANAPA